MIDLHCHILPGLDDGAGTLEDSLAMARKAAEDGIRTIVATPHTGNGSYENDPDTILEAVRWLDAGLREEAIPLNIVCGAEVYVSDHLLEKIQGRRVLTVNDGRRYVIVELPVFEIPRNLPDLIWQLKLSGVTPVISHPERNEAVQENVNGLCSAIAQGALAQVTGASLTGGFGKSARRCAEDLLKQNLAHVIATDAHSIDHRPPVLSHALAAATKIVGRDRALQMVTTIPEKIVQGHPIDAPSPEVKRRKLWKLGR